MAPLFQCTLPTPISLDFAEGSLPVEHYRIVMSADVRSSLNCAIHQLGGAILASPQPALTEPRSQDPAERHQQPVPILAAATPPSISGDEPDRECAAAVGSDASRLLVHDAQHVFGDDIIQE
jgi:hypothetical protein